VQRVPNAAHKPNFRFGERGPPFGRSDYRIKKLCRIGFQCGASDNGDKEAPPERTCERCDQIEVGDGRDRKFTIERLTP
jgi:hypothetical protein